MASPLMVRSARRDTIPARRGERLAGWLYVAPAMLILGLFFLLPVFSGLLLSLTDFDIYAISDLDNVRWIGLDNYRRLLGDPVFWQACRNTLYFVAVGVPGSIVASLAAALLVNSKRVRFPGLFRTIFFAPSVMTLVAIAIVWRYIYHPGVGPLNMLLGHLGLGPVDWLGNPRWAMLSILALSIWRSFGYNMILYIAALQNINPQYYEAAQLDGASWWDQLRHVTLPMLRPVTMLVVLITIVSSFQIFAEPYVMTAGGGPLGATLTLAMYMYREGFRWWNLGYGSTVAVALFLMTLAVTVCRAWLTRERAR